MDENQNGSSPLTPQRKRKRNSSQDVFKLAYKHVTFTPRPSSGRPGSPHRFFKSSYFVGYNEDAELDADLTNRPDEPSRSNSCAAANVPADIPGTACTTTKTKSNESNLPKHHLQQVVHQHANGLCVITVGELDDYSEKEIVSVEMIAKAAPESSAAERRKRQSKMLRQATVQDEVGIATPTGVLGHVNTKHGTHAIRGCVWGHILQVNDKLTPNLLQNDPLLNGHVAIVLPNGPFPPPILGDHDVNSDENHDENTKKLKQGEEE